MKRIFRITLIAPIGDMAHNTGAGIFWELPLGMFPSPNGSLLRNNKKQNSLGERNYYATRSDPSNPENPLHPDETLNSVAGRYGEHK
jgi:hypothetical protein